METIVAINTVRVVAGGLVAGVIRLIGGGIMQRFALAPVFEQEIRRNHPDLLATMQSGSAMAEMTALNLLMGITTIYIYAAMRPRFESRLASALSAGSATWCIAALNWCVAAVMGLFSWGHVALEAGITLITVLIATYVGSMIYPESDAPYQTRPTRVASSANAYS